MNSIKKYIIGNNIIDTISMKTIVDVSIQVENEVSGNYLLIKYTYIGKRNDRGRHDLWMLLKPGTCAQQALDVVRWRGHDR